MCSVFSLCLIFLCCQSQVHVVILHSVALKLRFGYFLLCLACVRIHFLLTFSLLSLCKFYCSLSFPSHVISYTTSCCCSFSILSFFCVNIDLRVKFDLWANFIFSEFIFLLVSCFCQIVERHTVNKTKTLCPICRQIVEDSFEYFV